LVISDIHGNMEYFRGLLNKAVFTPADELIIDGDFLEKGTNCLDTVFFIMELALRGNVHVVRGNCDGWHTIFEQGEEGDAHMLKYMQWRRRGLVWEMFKSLGIDPMEVDNITPLLPELHAYDGVFNFLRSLPDAIETERFTFVHSGYDPSKPLEEHNMGELDRIDRFLDKGYSFNKWVIVGHYPVMLYGEDKVCANPIIDKERKIVSIDGACVLKDDGQLNALIIPNKDSDDFFFESYDSFPTARVLSDQQESQHSYYIRWGDSTVQVLQRGEEFSHCRHLRTGYEMDILTKYLFTDEEITDCNDCTDYVLPLKAGDIVSVVERTSRGYFVKHRGYSGWYYGELQDE
jgi:protein phosphatase